MVRRYRYLRLNGQDVLAVYDGLVATADEIPIRRPAASNAASAVRKRHSEDIRFGVQDLLLFTHQRWRSAPSLGNWPRCRGPGRGASAFAPSLAQSEADGASTPGRPSSASIGKRTSPPTTTSQPRPRHVNCPRHRPAHARGDADVDDPDSGAWAGRCRSP